MSDLHMRSVDGPQADRARREAALRWRVLGKKWEENLDELRNDGVPFDLVVFTGDLGDWGHPTDYPRALAFLKQTCAALNVSLDRLFLVPGNHDIDRTIQRAAWKSLRRDIAADPRAYSKWMAGDDRGAMRDHGRRDKIMERQRAFWGAVAAELGRPELGPWQSPHKRLGYRQTVTLPGLTQPIHVIGLDTAWLAGDEHDAGELWLTEHQIGLLTTTECGAPLPGFRLALMHHRFADLADAADSRRLLADRVDLLLHGHQHEPAADVLQGPDDQLMVLAAGCLYEGDEEHRYLNACQVIDLKLDENTRPRSARVRFRGWSAKGLFWGDDALLYEKARDGSLRLRYGTRGWIFDNGPTLRRPRVLERHEIFIGRDAELARIGAAFDAGAGRGAIVAVQGMAGVGKTYLAHEFYARHPGRFGSYLHMVIDPEHPGTVATWMAVLGERAEIEGVRIDEVVVTEALREQRALVHMDNVDATPVAELVAALARVLVGVPMLVTGRYADIGTSAGSGWTRIELAPLDPQTALDLLRAELEGAGIAVPDAELRELVRQVAGLPLALHLAAGYLRRGVTVERFLARLRERGLALGPRDPADHVLGDRARGVLATSFAISRELLLAEEEAQAETWEAALVALGWAPRAGFGRSLGAAITGLDEATGAFEDFINAAVALSLVRRLRPEERATAAWAVHPLLGEFLRADTERAELDVRIGAWAARCADDASLDRAVRWNELSTEVASISEWLGVATDVAVSEILPIAWEFAISRGPIGPWLAAAKRVRRGGAPRYVLWALCQLAFGAGDLETSLDAATEMARLAREADDDRERALALGQIADVLVRRGELGDALRIWREDVIPVFERLGDVKARAITLGKIADVLTSRGELDEAFRIRREKEIPVYEQLGDMRGRAIALGNIASILRDRGELDDALRIWREEVLPVFERLGDERSRAFALREIASVLGNRGELNEELRILREEVLSAYERLGDERARAITLGMIADILVNRGELDEALRILREEELPLYERLRDVWARLVTLRNIADVLVARSELDEALRILREEVLPAYERLGDVRVRAITLGKIADVLLDRGELDEALRIWREEQLPVYERLGDARLRAITLGKISDVLVASGELDEALRLLREEALPVCEQLGDIRRRANTLDKIANVLRVRGELDEVLRIRREEELPIYERLGDVRSRANTLGKIADVLVARGELDEALRIRRGEELPVYEHFGDVRSRAIALGKIADVLVTRGELDEALRILREEGLPAFERFVDVRARTIMLGKIADVLVARGELDEALRIRREEELPVYQRLGDVRERAHTLEKIADVLVARGELDEALRILRQEALPAFERLGDVRERALTLGKIADVLDAQGELDEALRIRCEEEFPVYKRLGDIRSGAVTMGLAADIMARCGELDNALAVWRGSLAVFERLGEPGPIAAARQRIAIYETARKTIAQRKKGKTKKKRRRGKRR